jgi:hypothetical protein
MLAFVNPYSVTGINTESLGATGHDASPRQTGENTVVQFPFISR